MKLRKYSRFKFGLVLGIGALVASVLCVQCVRTYLYTDSVLVPLQAEREAERQDGALTAAARSAGITDSRSLRPAVQHVLESSTDRVLWMRVLDLEGNVLAQGGNPQDRATIPPQWWDRVEKHESLGRSVDTPEGKAFLAMLPFRLPRPPHSLETRTGRPELSGPPPGVHRPAAYVLEVAIHLRRSPVHSRGCVKT